MNFPSGGAAGQNSRALNPRWQDALGQPVLVENRSGAGGNIGGETAPMTSAQFHAKALEDGERFGKLVRERHALGD